ncbi:MAG: hypothetical protein ABW185_18795 [Sedimenticola sp.]
MSAGTDSFVDVVRRGKKSPGVSKNTPARANPTSNGGQPNVDIRKRQRNSTGGAASNITNIIKQPQQMLSDPTTPTVSTMPLSNFKSMSVDEKLDVIFTSVQAMNIVHNKVSDLERNVLTNTRDLDKTTDRVKVLEYKSIDLEARSRRNNLLFRGIPETANEDSLSVIRDFLSTQLQLTPDIPIHRAHRLGRMQYNRGERGFRPRHRPIIVALRDYQDVELILSNTRNLTGTAFGINRDYPPEIVNARKDLYPMLKRYRAEKPDSRVTIQFPARLLIDKTVIVDMFPDWYEVLKRSRHVTTHTRSTTQPYSIGDSNITISECSEKSTDSMEQEVDIVIHDSSHVPLAPGQPSSTHVNFSMERLLTDSQPQATGQDVGNSSNDPLPQDVVNRSNSSKTNIPT